MFAAVHLRQQTVVVNLDPGLLHGCHHSSLHSGVAEAAQLRRRKNEEDTGSRDTEAEQGLHRGEHIQAVSIDDCVLCRITDGQHKTISVKRSEKEKLRGF